MTLRLYLSAVTECAGRGRPGTAAARSGVRCPGLEPGAEQGPASTSTSLRSYKNTHKGSCYTFKEEDAYLICAAAADHLGCRLVATS